MRVTIRVPAGPNERYVDGAYDAQLGKQLPLRLENVIVSARLVGYKVERGGGAVDLTFVIWNDDDVNVSLSHPPATPE